jgi:hypothetical protein
MPQTHARAGIDQHFTADQNTERQRKPAQQLVAVDMQGQRSHQTKLHKPTDVRTGEAFQTGNIES